MKALVLILILNSICLNITQNDRLQSGKAYAINRISGQQKDLDTFFFLKKPNKNFSSNVILRYDDKLNQFSLMYDSTLVAYYNIEETPKEIHINNYSSLRQMLSYNDLHAREYKLEIKKEQKDQLVLIINNCGNLNLLSSPIYLFLHLKD